MDGRVVFETDDGEYRIVEKPDQNIELGDLKGDCFDPKANPDIDPSELKEDERDFEALVEREGVYGYVLEKWNPSPGCGYEHVDSCWGFVGQYSESDRSGKFDHYIVEEYLREIEDLKKKA
jgi:hypothetical protein